MDNPILFVLLAIILFGGGLAIAMGLLRRGGQGINQDEFRSKWMRIDASVNKENPASWQVALMDADKLLDHALIAKGARGNTLGERLKSSAKSFTKLNDVWMAHKLRNRVAHDSDVHLTLGDTGRALAAFKQALKDLGAI